MFSQILKHTPSLAIPGSKSKLLYDWQSVSMSWYRTPMWDLRPDITSCRNVTVCNVRRSKLLYDSQSVSEYVLVSSALVGLATRYYFLSECCCLKFAVLYLWGRPLWPEDWSATCSAISQWSESLRTRNHTLLSHLRLPQPRGPGPRVYIPPRNRVAQLYPRALGSYLSHA
jgi:hypothetical protein